MLSTKTIPQFVPYADEKEKEAVLKVIESGYYNEHKLTREFETRFAQFVGAKYCITCNNGTQALYLALLATQRDFGENAILIPDFNSIFVNNAGMQAKMPMVLIDVDKSGLYNDSTGSAFVIHTNGRKANAVILEDCCQAIDHHTKGAVSCYSFASTKHLTTAGQGGAVCCDDPDVFDMLSRLKDHGRNDRQQLKPMSDEFTQWGFNAKFTEIQATFGLVQLQKLASRLSRLEKMYAIVNELLYDNKDISFIDGIPKWYIDILVEYPQKLVENLAKHGIQARRFPKPLHMQPIYESLPKVKLFKNSEHLYNHGVFLPSTTNLSDEDLHYICDKVKQCLT